jgi:type I restriction enzyme R subunit
MNENQIEQELISKLSELKYIYRHDIRDRASLEANFRSKFNSLNGVTLTDSEFERLLEQVISSNVFENAKHLREINTFTRDDSTPLNYTLVNIKDWCKNTFEVINQLRINTDNSNHRYDVIVLINGIPMVQIELKTLELSPRRAMQQIVGYKNDAGNGYTKTLLCFMQLFIVSNRSDTMYFANNETRHFSFDADERFLPIYRLADEKNKKITHLNDFADAFLAKCTLGQMISRYMVLVQSEQKLLIMRPYQIYAVKAIIDCIEQNRGNGYIWHTTGSGKTLTSFKASTLLKDRPEIEKCLFVVDRKDLDRQTREEFNKFQENCVEQNTDTESLVRRLLSTNYADKVIVTTIQKLGLALDAAHKKNYKARLQPLRDKRVVFIFDECHRSQFGENHQAIKEFFPKAQLFGFTGTPIFEDNSTYKKIEGTEATMLTTEKIFEKELHAYTITHAIDDGNVLRFHVDFFKPDGKTSVKAGDTLAKEAVVKAIVAKHDNATSQRKFNAILATASINDAIEYHKKFKDLQNQLQADDPDFTPLNIACVFSPPADGNSDVRQIQEDLPQERLDNEENPEGKKAALQSIMADYNAQYGTNHTIANFDLYYQDIQKRIKDQQWPNKDLPHNQKIDITIVVDMLLTGFDSKYLNTLYVDKNLKHHGLIQAFSRTNRVLNDTKPYGNVLDFRGQKDAVDFAIGLFSGEKSQEEAEKIWMVEAAPVVLGKFDTAVQKLSDFMTSQGLEATPAQIANLKGDTARAQFVNLFKEVQRLKTQLDQYTDLTDEQAQVIDTIMPVNELRAFRGQYISTAQQLKELQGKTPNDNAVQQLDFEFVLFASALIDYDYIMGLMANYTQEKPRLKMSRGQILSLIASDAKFIDQREDLEAYLDTLTQGEGRTKEQILAGYATFKADKRSREISSIATQFGLTAQALQDFFDRTMTRMILDGDLLTDLMEPLGLGWKDRANQEFALMQQLIPLLNKETAGREISGLAAYEH